MKRGRKKRPIKILVFDQGTLSSGYALFNGSDLVKHGALSADKKEEYWIRIQWMRNKIEHMVEEWNPEFVVIEGIAGQRDLQALIKLGQLQGLIMGTAFAHNIPVDVMAPPHWRRLNGFKQGGGTKRAELKQQAFDMVQAEYGLEPEPTEDEAEAIAIGIAWLRERGFLPALMREDYIKRLNNKEKKGNGKKRKKRSSTSKTGT